MQNDVLTGKTPFGLSQVIQNTNNAGHSLVRTAGSFVTINGSKIADPILTEVLLNQLVLTERTDDVVKMGANYGTCRYFSSTVPNGHEAFQGAVSIDEFVKICHENGLNMDVSINPTKDFGGTAAHQNEIVSSHVPVQKASEIWIAIGSPNGPSANWKLEDGIIYTWHPGPVYSPTTTVIKLSE